MKNITSIVLLFLYLSTFTEMHQVMRLPILFAHYQEHLSQKGDIGFLDYLSSHYLDDSHEDNRHQDLPFKYKHCEILHLVIAVVPFPGPSAFVSFSLWNQPRVSYEPQFHYQFAIASVWQPPRPFLL